jgi:transcriptional regulatory protein RtcR
MKQKKMVVIGLLGSRLDQGHGSERWEKWRPTVSLFQHEDLLIDRLELIYDVRHAALQGSVSRDIHQISPETELRNHPVEWRDPWDFEESYGLLHDWARSYTFDHEHEDYLIHITTGTHVNQICLFLLTEARYLPGRLIQTGPPKGSTKDPGPSRSIIDLDLSRYDKLAARFLTEQSESLSFLKSGIDTRNDRFNRLIEQIELVVGQSRDPVLLTGPTGAGKSRLARRIYDLKKDRRQVTGPFVPVNCATLRGDAAMSTLFGHIKGSFTGATADRAGLLQKADGGVLFLDEIGELGADEQAMLLRALEEKLFYPLGSDREVSSNFQLIAGTNQDLKSRIRQGLFRKDLLARINLWAFDLPGLSERREDIGPNIQFEIEQASMKRSERVAFNKEALEFYLRQANKGDSPWSGNFRDLNASITRLATVAAGRRVTTEMVQEEWGRLRTGWSHGGEGAAEVLLERLLDAETLAQIDPFDQVQLEYVVQTCLQAHSLSEAGRKLFKASRTRKKSANDSDRIKKYLSKFNLTLESIHEVLHSGT